MRLRVSRLCMIALIALAVADLGCRSAETRTTRTEDDGPAVPRFAKSGVPDSVMLRPQTEGGFGSGSLQ